VVGELSHPYGAYVATSVIAISVIGKTIRFHDVRRRCTITAAV
jgi:hypothetical protein